MQKQLYDKNYYLCTGYEMEKINKKIIYYHLPKSGGTTLTNIFLSIFTNPYRIYGFQIKNNHTPSSYENFTINLESIKKKNYDFISGHIQFLDFFRDRLSITTIRDPIERTISHYNNLFDRGIVNSSMTLEDCFKEGFIPKNPITQMFSCNNSEKTELNYKNKEIAINNLKKIDFLVNSNDVDKLINHIISLYDLPNVLFQRLHKRRENFFKINNLSEEVVKQYNLYDLDIYSQLKTNEFFYKFSSGYKKRDKDNYLIYSIDFKIDNHNKIITPKPIFKNFINFLKKEKFIINEV